jgi:hypothetical protein
MKNQILLDFKLVVLHSEHIIWNALVHMHTLKILLRPLDDTP